MKKILILLALCPFILLADWDDRPHILLKQKQLDFDSLHFHKDFELSDTMQSYSLAKTLDLSISISDVEPYSKEWYYLSGQYDSFCQIIEIHEIYRLLDSR